jgi:replicative DNA helicase
MKLLAQELKIPVNREVENRQDQKPKLSYLRESGALEQDVDLVLLLHRQDEGQVDLIVAKQRNSPIGVAKLLYVKQQMRFENLAVQTVRLG